MARAKKQVKVGDEVQPPRLGAMSNLFRGNPEQVAELFLQYSLESVQILPNFPGIRFSNAEDVQTSVCQEIGNAFLNAKLSVAAVSAHTNFVDPDRNRRQRMIKRFDALIEHCQDFGTKYLVTETGTLNSDHPWEDTPENHTAEALKRLIKSLEPSAKLAEQTGVTILLEGYLYHVVSSASRALAVREALGESIQFVMDPPNYYTRSMTSAAKKSLRDLFASLGELAPLAHAKDVRYTGTTHTTPRAGSGSLDYKEYLELLHQYQPECPLIFEQIRPEELRESVDFIDRFFD